MDVTEHTRIMRLYESHMQVKKLSTSGTIHLHLNSVKVFLIFCDKFRQQLVLPEHWSFADLGVRELEAFIQYQIDVRHWQRSTIVTCVSGIKGLFEYLALTNQLVGNPVQHFKLPRQLSEIGLQKYDIKKINQLFQTTPENTLKGCQQYLLLELIYGLGMSLVKIVNLKSAVPELDEGKVRFYFQNSRYQDYPFSPLALKILKTYLKIIDIIDCHESFWVTQKGKNMSTGQLQALLNKYFESHNMPAISANELRDLSVQHFSKEGADVRSLQTLRQVKQLRRLQSLKKSDFSKLQNSFRNIHIRNKSTKTNGDL